MMQPDTNPQEQQRDGLLYALVHAALLAISTSALIVWLSYDSSECPSLLPY